MAALAPALLLPAAVSGFSTSLLSFAQDGSRSARLPGTVNALSAEADPVQLGASGHLPRNDQPSPDLLRTAAQPQELATGAGPLVDLPHGPLGSPEPMLRAYIQAADRLAVMDPGCGVHWSVLASIGRIESGHARSGKVDVRGTTVSAILGPRLSGTPGNAAIPDTDGGKFDGDPVWDRAVGPMQFIPATWRRYAVDGNGDGVASPHNAQDAAVAAGEYLCASELDLRDPRNLAAAIFSYNHSESYVRTVLVWAAAYARGVLPMPSELAPAVRDTEVLAGSRMPNRPRVRGNPHHDPGGPPPRASEPRRGGQPGDQHGGQPPSEQPPRDGQPPGPPPDNGAPPSAPGTPPPLLPAPVLPAPPVQLPAPPTPPQLPPLPAPPQTSASPVAPEPTTPPTTTSRPSSATKPPSSTSKPAPSPTQAPSTSQPVPSTTQPPSTTTQPPTTTTRPPSSTSQAPSSTTRPPSSDSSVVKPAVCELVTLLTGNFLTQPQSGASVSPGASRPEEAKPGTLVYVKPATGGPLTPCSVPEGYLPHK